MSNKTESDLLHSLRTVLDVARDLELELRKPVVDPRQNLKNLQSAVLNLGQAKAAKSLHCPDEYVGQWKQHLENEEVRIEGRALRYLCWQPEIATSQRFQYYLDLNNIELNARPLQGLVRCCHARWSLEFARSQAITRVRDRMERYKGANRLLSEWKDNSSTILGPKGAEEFGAELVQNLEGIKRHCENWGIGDETSSYVQTAVRHATELCRNQMDRVPKLRDYLLSELLPWMGWPPDVFKQEIKQTILHPVVTRSGDVQECVRLFVLNDARLGDPRLPRNRLNWVGVSEAERRVIEWLSQLDIVFFFESVLPANKDEHRRKDFWLRYVPSVRRSRPLLTRDDRYRVEELLREKGQKLTHFGLMTDRTTPKTSAFLLEFDKLLVVEFSEVNNACYLYRKSDVAKIIPDFYTSQPFDVNKLKNHQLSFISISHKEGQLSWWMAGKDSPNFGTT